VKWLLGKTLIAVFAIGIVGCSLPPSIVAPTQPVEPSPTLVATSTLDLSAAGTQIAALTATQAAFSHPSEETATAVVVEAQAAAQTQLALAASPTPIVTRTPRPTSTSTASQTELPTQTARPASTLVPSTPTITLPTADPEGFTLTGDVVYRQAPVAGVTVHIWNAATGQEFSTISDASGHFAIAGMPEGKWIYQAYAENLVSLRFEGSKHGSSCSGGKQCTVEAVRRQNVTVTIRMARTDLIEFKEHTRTAANIRMVGDVAWEEVPGAVEYHFKVYGRFLDGWQVYTSVLIHETFAITKGVYSDLTVVGECYTHEVSAWGLDGNDPMAWTSIVICRPD
jgi:hypothetical protein